MKNQKVALAAPSMKMRLLAVIPRPVKKSVKRALKPIEKAWIPVKVAVFALWHKLEEDRSADTERALIHRYILFSYIVGMPVPIGRNLGDNIQTIATKRAISQVDDLATFITVPRRRLIFYKNQSPAICVMQGWFEHGTLNFLPGPSVVPVWIGTHWQNLTRAQLKFLLRLRPNALRGAEIGCRDKSTLKFCKEQGIPAYFSRCLTLTLPRRTTEPKSPRTFIVNCPDWIVALFPQHVKESATLVAQRSVLMELNLYDEKARELLGRYRDEAGLVITTALHCAQPCIAMGIPVVFIDPLYREADRFSAMQGIIPIWTKEDLENGKVNFSPKAPDIEPLKTLMIENLDLSIRKAKNLPFDADRMAKIRHKIASFQTPESQKGVASYASNPDGQSRAWRR